MKNVFQEDPSLIYEIRQGVERECLRVNSDGTTSKKAHPVELGSKLTHSLITTDYSENLLEFITKVHSNTNALLSELETIHAFTQKNIGSELLWSNSMPSSLPIDSQIPLADYGKSNVGKLKTLYRKGLGFRYGRSMQSIAGVHYNFSLSDNFWELRKKQERSELSISDYKNEQYFRLIRNFQRNKWILVYLFGASPVVDKSFLDGKKHDLELLNKDTYYSPNGTSLRMGGLGYTSSAQSEIGICYNNVQNYIQTLEQARLSSFGEYEKIGLKTNGEYNQLNTNLLQIDNEFYSTVRPKNIAKSNESALKALHYRGIEYVEIRLIDIDPFSPVGISTERIHFLHLFLLWCLSESPSPISDSECAELNFNFKEAVLNGRSKSPKLRKGEQEVSLNDYLEDILNQIDSFSKGIQKLEPLYGVALDMQLRKVQEKDQLPSQKMINELGEGSFIKYGIEKSQKFSQDYKIKIEDEKKFEKYSLESLELQTKIEKNDSQTFDEYLVDYFKNIKI